MSRAKFRDWFLLFRPWSYTATLVPFLVIAGAMRGFHGFDGHPGFVWWRWWLALAAALPLQAACNLLNTWGDERSGVDDVPGAIRTTPQVHEGRVSMRAVLAAAIGCVVASGLLAGPLFFVRFVSYGEGFMDVDFLFNWPLLVVALIGLFGACNYATGVKFKYHGLGVPFVFFLMGTIEMAGVLFAAVPSLMRELTPLEIVVSPFAWVLALGVSLPVNCLVAVIMHGNDMRDIPSDRAAGIKTVASMLGPKGALSLYYSLHLLPYATAAVSCWAVQSLRGLSLREFAQMGAVSWLLPFAALPLTIRTLRTATRVYCSCPGNPPWRGLERASGGIHFVFGLLYALALSLV